MAILKYHIRIEGKQHTLSYAKRSTAEGVVAAVKKEIPDLGLAMTIVYNEWDSFYSLIGDRDLDEEVRNALKILRKL